MRGTVVSLRPAPLLLLAVALVTGCGGTSYAAKADAVCEKYTKQTNALGQPKSISELAVIADKTLPILDRAAKELSALDPPPDKRGLATQWLQQFATVRGDLREIRDRARTGDKAGMTAVVLRAQHDNARANELGTRLGFKVCNKN